MLRMGVYTMHDFHVFRQFEFNKCVMDGVFPCRWASDSGMGYGEPLFNFYGQFPYWIGEAFHFLGFSIINSVKLLFILSLVVSGVVMYLVSRKFWGDLGGVVSAILYMYAPYRSVDVWVRGALNESLALVFYPLIFYNLDQFISTRRQRNLWVLVVSMSMLITTHNLSVVMVAPFLAIWWLVRTIRAREFKHVFGLGIAALLSLGLSAYYLLPVIFENSLVTLSKTTQGYYDYRAHFATLHELFISRFWGYGASLWGPVDGLSFSVGQINWIIVAVLLVIVVFKRNFGERKLIFYLLAGLGLAAIFLTHNKSQFIWRLFPFMAYIQFPWRFLGVAVFFLSLASGAVAQIIPSKIRVMSLVGIILLAILSNVYYFRPDIWRYVTDAQQFSGQLWDEERSSALQDFWPASAPDEPVAFAPLLSKSQIKSSSASFSVMANDISTSFPIVYFPGWKAWENGKSVAIHPGGKLGLITANLTPGLHTINLQFTNTWPRTVGNLISGLSLGILVLWYIKMRGWRSA